MEHIVQFGIGIDDAVIVKQIHENAEKKIIESLEKEVREIIFETSHYGKLIKAPTTWTEMRIDDFLEKHKDEILDIAGKYLAERLARTKTGKALLEQ